MFKKVLQMKKRIIRTIWALNKYLEIERKTMLKSLQNSKRYEDPLCLTRYGYKVFSKNEEDGIISEIFKRIGTTNKTFVEFGAGNGLENNTLALLFQSWKGLWIEASLKSYNNIIKGYANKITSGELKVSHSFLYKNNINQILQNNLKEEEIDLLSIDVDGNDFHLFDAISVIRTRVLVIEYNAKFHPPIEYCMQYNPQHKWDGTDYFGASLKFLELNLKKKGYLLVGCNLTGGNAFFVAEELVNDKFLSPFTAEKHYEPARYEIAGLSAGHPPSFKTLNNV